MSQVRLMSGEFSDLKTLTMVTPSASYLLGSLLAYLRKACEIRPLLEVWALSTHSPVPQCVTLARGERMSAELPLGSATDTEPSTAPRDGPRALRVSRELRVRCSLDSKKSYHSECSDDVRIKRSVESILGI